MKRAAHLSYSQCKSYQHCPMQFKLEKINHVPEVPAVYLLGGTALHKVSEEYDRDRDFEPLLNRDWAAERFSELFEEAVEKAKEVEPDVSKWRVGGKRSVAKPNKDDLEVWRRDAPEFAAMYVDWREETQWPILEVADGVPAIELNITMTLGGKPFKMGIDRVFAPEGQLMVVDHKSGRKPDNEQQLGVYRVGLEETFGLTADFGAFYLFNAGKLTPPAPLERWTKSRLDHWYSGIDRAIDARAFPPKPSSMCISCSVREFCPAVDGARAAEFEGVNEWASSVA